MPQPRFTLALGSVFLLAACSGAGGSGGRDPGSWEHTQTTENGVTTVRTLSGSRWGGPARLVEELSIGVLEGPDEYTFGSVSSVWATDDRILVADNRLDAVRVYDAEGGYLFDVGAKGQGPGEFESVGAVAVLPDGRIAVHDGSKVLVYDPDGEFIEQWGGGEGFRFFGPGMMALDAEGTLYTRKPIFPEERAGMGPTDVRWVLTPLGPGNEDAEPLEAPSFDYEPPTMDLTIGDSRIRVSVPFAPSTHWAMLPGGGFVAGVSDDYHFEVQRPGTEPLVIEKAYEPVPVNPDEVELRKRTQTMMVNGRRPDIDWGSMQVPENKPAYDGFVVSRDERILVLVPGPVTVNAACLEPDVTPADLRAMDCTEGSGAVDVFETDGAFLGSFELPDGLNLGFGGFVRGDLVWAPVQDEMGTVTVKRYRIVPPADTSET